MSLTRIIQPIFASRRRALDKYQTQAEQLQMQVLHRLVNKAKDTEWGRNHGFASVSSYEDFAKTSGINTYEELKLAIDRMRQGESDILWPG